jgi:hypothetical protein
MLIIFEWGESCQTWKSIGFRVKGRKELKKLMVYGDFIDLT